MSPDLDSGCQTEWGYPKADAEGVTPQNFEQDSFRGYGGSMKWGTRKLVKRSGRRIEMSSEAVDRAGLVGDHETQATRDSSPYQDPVSPSVVETSPRSRRWDSPARKPNSTELLCHELGNSIFLLIGSKKSE